ncbi:hypothetical protein [Sphingobium limneticum]|jgi:hypothetical protein|uniref:Uncharacterized protein n=1 Tax=Sphingobium limneticum TaxID=1007511 RepID=A0A5J5HTK8_9SPHN|nr:hypothetical protein [Sphingobium limneticum]KAA9013125.1 hypothetical protein F4U96_19580 [Sphingobium limneticum]KAA9025423.1 hypothetical protein F4U95_19705 [Sphingobium limneticum]
MNEPTLRKSRLALAGGLVIALAVGGTGFLIGRGTSPREVEPSAAPVTTAPVAAQPTPSLPDPRDLVKTRADLIALASQASDALASGQPLPEGVADLAGQRFELRLPFGCRGPSEAGSDSPMRWRYDADAKALRVHVSPVVWSSDGLRASEDGSASDVVAEGFWIPRPWTASEACPPSQDSVAPTGADAVTLPGQALAVAQFSGGAGQRLRDGKPYETVVRAAADEVPDGQGLRLRLRGRIGETADGTPVSCRQPAGPEQRPICIIAVTLNDVAIDNPRTGKSLATWTADRAGLADR